MKLTNNEIVELILKTEHTIFNIPGVAVQDQNDLKQRVYEIILNKDNDTLNEIIKKGNIYGYVKNMVKYQVWDPYQFKSSIKQGSKELKEYHLEEEVDDSVKDFQEFKQLVVSNDKLDLVIDYVLLKMYNSKKIDEFFKYAMFYAYYLSFERFTLKDMSKFLRRSKSSIHSYNQRVIKELKEELNK